MALLRTVFLDMDNTIMDFQKGHDLESSLQAMKDPEYYKTVVPYEAAMDALGTLSDNFNVAIISGIPDLKMHGKYLGEMSCEEYMKYYETVKQIKLDMLYKYFGKNFFETIEFCKASESKAHLVNYRFYNSDKKEFCHSALVDDIESYCTTWRQLGGKAYRVTKSNTLSVVTKQIIHDNTL